jgi:L,D-transpeptidase-like protein
LLLASLLCSCARGAEPHPAPPEVVVAAATPRPSADRTRPADEVLELARRSYRCARASGDLDASPVFTVIDYSLPSVERRLWVVDMNTGEVLFHELVAHGRGSGDNFARSFSNEPGSKQTSLGLYRTGAAYQGTHGISLYLTGLEPGVNDQAAARDIVVHGADYVSDAFAKRWGRLGRSWGCPALERSVVGPLIDRIQGGTGMFIYYPDAEWLRTSRFLHCSEPD